jgi:hypothetical protein
MIACLSFVYFTMNPAAELKSQHPRHEACHCQLVGADALRDLL